MATTNPLSEVQPNHGLGLLLLGASLHDVLTFLKSKPQVYPDIAVSFSSSRPVQSPVVLELPQNGLRLRFDGLDQRLRLIEVLDFTKSKLTYKNTDVVRIPDSAITTAASPANSGGPTFRHVYHKLFGPTFSGEYFSPESKGDGTKGTYVLSYPGVAFSFPLQDASWSPEADFVSLLSSNAASVAQSMAIFSGSSWSDARQELFSRAPPNSRTLLGAARSKELTPDEVELVKIHGGGRLELLRRSAPSFWITLSETTPQDLVAELGPPDAIYRKHDRRLSIHRPSTSTETRGQGSTEGPFDTNQSSRPNTDDSDEGSDCNDDSDVSTVEHFYNYFHHGFDILISRPTQKSPMPPRVVNDKSAPAGTRGASSSHSTLVTQELTATKVLLHGNIPGSYPFNRHRRVRWVLDYDTTAKSSSAISSELPFEEVSGRLKDTWRKSYSSEEEETRFQKGMVLNRGWGDSPSSSCELLGGWEEGLDTKKNATNGASLEGGSGLGNTELFGFPGLVFEVLKNDAVTCLTVF